MLSKVFLVQNEFMSHSGSSDPVTPFDVINRSEIIV